MYAIPRPSSRVAAAALFASRLVPSQRHLPSPLVALCGVGLSLGAVALLLLAVAGSDLLLTAALSARFLRLGLVSLFALPALSLLVPRTVWASSGFAFRYRRIAAVGLGVGIVLMPTILFLSALLSPALKYLLCVPACGFTAGILFVVVRLFFEGPTGREKWVWLSVLTSLTFGLGLGLFAFDGPLPVPAPLSDYASSLRFALRSMHHLSLSVSILTLAWWRLTQDEDAGTS